MTSRKTRRRGSEKNSNKIESKAKAKLVVMLVSVFLMIFSLLQVYYLLMYTIGKEVPEEKLKVYRWVQLIVSGKEAETEQSSI